MEEKIKLIKNRQLDDTYIIIYVIKNEIKYNTKDKLVSRNIYTFVGINNLGYRTVIDIILEENNNHFWLDVFESFKARGVKKIFFLSIIKNKQIIRSLKISFPETIITLSLTDTIYSIYKYIEGKRRNKFISQIRNLCIQETKEEFNDKYNMFKEDYKNNYIICCLIDKKIKEIDEYYKYNLNIRNLIFNHNRITDLYDIIIRYSKNNYINHINELWEYLYDEIIYMEEYKSYTKKNWTNILNDLYVCFPESLEYLIRE